MRDQGRRTKDRERRGGMWVSGLLLVASLALLTLGLTQVQVSAGRAGR